MSGSLSPEISRPTYDYATQRCGIVHFGIGAFHRAHQAVYTDDAMAGGDQHWRIIGVSLRSKAVADQINPQDGLYTIVQRSAKGSSARLIGSVSHVIVAPENPDDVISALASPDTNVVSFTITEKGYLRRPDGRLDTADQALAKDINGEGQPRTIYGFLAAGLARRREAGLPGLTLISCDNLAHNGTRLMALITEYLESTDSDLAIWFAQYCRCPNTMVDRIVPAVTDQDRAQLALTSGLNDEAVVVTEPFCQWVMEDNFAGPRPRWENVGAQIVPEVGPYEAAKLRMLNGAHSALAYLGLARGYKYVHEAIADPKLSALIVDLMQREAAPTLGIVPGLNLENYADALIKRFANSALPHRLIQIAMDGSQKIPQRWLEPLAINRAQGRFCPATLEALAAWVTHIRGAARPVDDPMAAELTKLWKLHGADGIVGALFGEAGLFSATWTVSMKDMEVLNQHISDGIH